MFVLEGDVLYIEYMRMFFLFLRNCDYGNDFCVYLCYLGWVLVVFVMREEIVVLFFVVEFIKIFVVLLVGFLIFGVGSIGVFVFYVSFLVRRRRVLVMYW